MMSGDLEGHDGKVSIGSINITNLQFADEEQELENLAESHDKDCTRYKMKISA